MISRVTWDGDAYQARFDALAASGVDVHGEAAFVLLARARPRVGARRGLRHRPGRDRARAARRRRRRRRRRRVDARAPRASRPPTSSGSSTTSRRSTSAAPSTSVLMAGNVPLFTPAGNARRASVAGCARHVGPGGALVAGFQLGRGLRARRVRRALRGRRAGARRALRHLGSRAVRARRRLRRLGPPPPLIPGEVSPRRRECRLTSRAVTIYRDQSRAF